MLSYFSRSEVSKILNIKPGRLQYWDRIGLVRPSFRQGRVSYYDFRDLICLRTALGLVSRGLTARKIQKSIASLMKLIPEYDDHLSNKRIYIFGDRVIISHKNRLIDTHTGQFLFKFDLDDFTQEVDGQLHVFDTKSAADWFKEGVDLDGSEETYDLAIEAYRQAIKKDPQFADAYVNMGTIYYNQGKYIDAQRCFRLAIDRNPYHGKAHFNLGNVLDELNCTEEAVQYYERSLEVDPFFSDAHFNLAATCEKLNLWDRALKHWKCYLNLDSTSKHAQVARRRVKLVQSQLALER